MVSTEQSVGDVSRGRGLSRLEVYTTLVSGLGVLLLVRALGNVPAQRPDLWLFLALVAISELTTSDVFAPQMGFSVSTTVVIAILLLYGPLAAALGSMVGGLGMTLVAYYEYQAQGRRAAGSLLQRSCFNMAAMGLSAYIAGTVYSALNGAAGHVALASNALPLAAAALVSEFVNSGLVVGAVSLQTGRRPLAIWRENVSWALPRNIATIIVCGAGLAAGYEIAGLFGLAVFFVPLLLTIYSFRLYVGRTKDQVTQLEKNILERKRAEEALQRAHEDLEERVRRRTAELAQVNEMLKAEIAERMQAVDKMRASLLEKETLLKEVHHRVKNNLQVISSLLHLQSLEVDNAEALALFRESRNRVQSIALVHEKLYQSQNLERVNFTEYVGSLTSALYHSYGASPHVTALRIEGDEVQLSLETAVPCALIVNELVSNALRHAFLDRGKGEIHVGLHADGERFVLEVSDNGVGLPANWDVRTARTLGLQLVHMLVGQIGGTIDRAAGPGTRFRIAFADPQTAPRAQAERARVPARLVQTHANSKQGGARHAPLPAH